MKKNVENCATEELLAVITKLCMGWRSSPVTISHTGTRVIVAQDESYIDEKDRWFNVTVAISSHYDDKGKNTSVTAHGRTLHTALAALAEEVVKFQENLSKRRQEEASKARSLFEEYFNPPELCGADDSVPYEYATLGDKCKNTLPCVKHGPKSQGPYR